MGADQGIDDTAVQPQSPLCLKERIARALEEAKRRATMVSQSLYAAVDSVTDRVFSCTEVMEETVPGGSVVEPDAAPSNYDMGVETTFAGAATTSDAQHPVPQSADDANSIIKEMTMQCTETVSRSQSAAERWLNIDPERTSSGLFNHQYRPIDNFSDVQVKDVSKAAMEHFIHKDRQQGVAEIILHIDGGGPRPLKSGRSPGTWAIPVCTRGPDDAYVALLWRGHQ